jgi:hypothetical protein
MGLGDHVVVAVLLACVLVAGLALILVTDPRHARDRLALPGGLLIGAVVFVAVTSAGRAALQTGSESRYVDVLAALTLPSITVAIDAVARRWAWFLPAGLILLLAGIPGNIDAMRERDPFAEGNRELVLTYPRVPMAREVSRNTEPDPVLHPDMTIGWLLAGVASGRIPAPTESSGANRATATLALALQQGDAAVRGGCRVLAEPVTRRLAAGEHLTLRGGPVLAFQAGAASPYAFRRFDPARGNALEARGPINLVLRSPDTARPAVICG